MTLPVTFVLLSFFTLLLCWLSASVTDDKAEDKALELENSINELLPQTQCGECDYPGCQPYARAIVAGRANIDQCLPGGNQTIERIASLLGEDANPLDVDHPLVPPSTVARIDESTCIGCVKCIRACPVDAIIGAAKQLHGVIESECTGCELCLAPCPVDCIRMEVVQEKVSEWVWNKPLANYPTRS